MWSVCSAAVCDRANEFLQKSEGDMRHKNKLQQGDCDYKIARIEFFLNYGLGIQVKAYITKIYQTG